MTTKADTHPPCPYCGERQSKAEAITIWIGRKHHQDEDHCRACDQQIVFGFRFGSGHMSEIMTGAIVYEWRKP